MTLDEILRVVRLHSKRIRRVEHRLDELIEQFDKLAANAGGGGRISGDLSRIERGVESLLRHAFLDRDELDFPERLTSQRFRLLSQHGEDGMILEFFREAGVANARFAELGCGYNGGNSGFLARELGWSGLMVDADSSRVAKVGRRFNTQRVQAAASWITRENVNELLSSHGLSGEIDLLSVDIDGNDYWIWEAIETSSPRLAIIEYNAGFGAERAVVVPYSAEFDRSLHGGAYYGASLEALCRLARLKGYRLVAVEPQGVNAFFARNDVAPHIPAVTAAAVFMPKLRAKVEQLAHGTGTGAPIAGPADQFALIEQQGLPLLDLDDLTPPA